MSLRWVLLLSLSVSAAAHARSQVSLLGGRSLNLSLLAQNQSPPPPPPQMQGGQEQEQPPLPAEPAPGENPPPSLGAVLGFMISGGVCLLNGVPLTIYGLLIIALGAAFAGSAATTGTSTTVFTVEGVVFLVIGLALDGVGAFLLIHGNNLRKERNAYNEAHGITDRPPQPPGLMPPSALAWRF